jgi:hypothetical protein
MGGEVFVNAFFARCDVSVLIDVSVTREVVFELAGHAEKVPSCGIPSLIGWPGGRQMLYPLRHVPVIMGVSSTLSPP